MEQDQFFGGPFALRILNPHSVQPFALQRMTRNCQKAKRLRIVRGQKIDMQERVGAVRRVRQKREACLIYQGMYRA